MSYRTASLDDLRRFTRLWPLDAANLIARERERYAALDARFAESERVRRLLAEALGAIQWSGYAMIGAEPCPNCGSERDESHSDGCIVGVALADSEALDQKTGEA